MNKNLIFLLLLISVIPASYFLIMPGFYEPHDLHHFADIFQMYRAIETGQVPPRLGPDFLYGWGYPLFNFYYVLPFYLGAFFYAITDSLTQSYELVFITSLVLSIFGMYLFLKNFFNETASFVGAFLYLYTPFRALEVYVRGAMGEALAIGILPFVLWSVTKVIKSPSHKNIAIFAAILALFILTHNYFWLLSFPIILIFSLVLIYFERNRVQILKRLAVGSLLGAGASAYWWLPAFMEYNSLPELTPFLIEDHFPFLKQLVIPSWGYGVSQWGPDDELSMQIGIVNLAVLFLVGVLTLLKKKTDRKVKYLAAWAIGGFFLAIFFMNVRSLPLWKLLPIYQFVQFPWRLLFITTFFTSFLAALLVFITPSKLRTVVGISIVVASFILTINYFQPSKVFYKEDEVYLNRFFAGETVSEEYKNYSEDYLLLPEDFEKANFIPEQTITSETATINNLQEINSINWKAEISADTESKVTFWKYNFPGWHAYVDGKEVSTLTRPPRGQVEITIPTGNHTVEFRWEETTMRKVADVMSLISLGAVAVLLLSTKRKVIN